MKTSLLTKFAFVAVLVASLGDVAFAKSLAAPQPMSLRSSVNAQPASKPAVTSGTQTAQVPGFDIQPTPEQKREQRRARAEREAAHPSVSSTIPPAP